MLLSIIRYLKGYLRIRVVGYSPERFLNACCHRGIFLWNLSSVEGAYDMYITLRGFRKLKPIIKKTGAKVIITGRFGLPFFIHRYRKRKVFFLGALGCVFLIYVMSLFIWDIDIRGNSSRTDETLLQFLETTDVTHGMKKSEVMCERIVKDIRREYNDIIWVSASIRGTRLIIQVKENEDVFTEPIEEEKENDTGTDIVADRDGVITEMVTRQGVPLVKIGDTVKEGDILVSGRVDILNDSQEVVNYQYVTSDADIKVQTTTPYENEMETTYEIKTYPELKRTLDYIRVGDYLIGLGAMANVYEQFELRTTEYQLCIGDHFLLPIWIGKRLLVPYTATEENYSEETIINELSAKFQTDCEELQKKGVEILQNDVKIYREQSLAIARGNLIVIMAIGQSSPTEILPVPERVTEDGGT